MKENEKKITKSKPKKWKKDFAMKSKTWKIHKSKPR